MSEKANDRNNDAGKAADASESALQEELRREAEEGRDAIGDIAENRNLSGSTTWETLPKEPRAD
jgi:hypothetical protein